MIFRFGITTPANTPSTSRQRTTLKLASGIIHHLDVQFPPGPSGTLHLHINNSLHQIFPFNTGEAFAADNVNISFRDFINFQEPPFDLTAFTWNTDTANDHFIIIRIGILPARIAAPWLQTLTERLASVFGG
ncbi:hypothetical protein LCGC14_2981530 [marine sediment metagenome]|uniref:Uncharacterized protein n=1 Tax=marine sediment metagenome TaxID=412755 RepID=A0A0F8X7B7_9ZZZZ